MKSLIEAHIFLLRSIGVWTTLVVALSCVTPVAAQDSNVQRLLDSFVISEEIPGAVLLISAPDGRWLVTSGVANLETEAPVSPETRFYAASVGKMPVAAAILSLVEDGALSLDQEVWPLINDIAGIERLENADGVTLAQLLNHTSGLSEYLIDEFASTSAAAPAQAWSPDEALIFAYDDPAPARVGQVFEYTNTNYVLLGHILATISGSLEAALTRHVFNPAGMVESSVGADEGDWLLARGYIDGGQTDVSLQGWNSVLGDGPVITDVLDLEKFTFALFRDERIVSSDFLEQMTTGSYLEESYGLGIGIDEDDWGEWFGHSGGYDGFEADVRYYPDDEVALIYLSNGNQVSEESLLQLAADWYFTD